MTRILWKTFPELALEPLDHCKSHREAVLSCDFHVRLVWKLIRVRERLQCARIIGVESKLCACAR